MNKICGVYKIMNTVTGDFYVGSSKDVMKRWREHKCQSSWKLQPNNLMYRDMQKYGLDCFRFQILAPVRPECLKQVEQEFIELLQPSYNNYRANGQNIKRYKETKREYYQSNRGKETHHKATRKYDNQRCLYNGETLTLRALSARFRRAEIEHPVKEAKKYLLATK